MLIKIILIITTVFTIGYLGTELHQCREELYATKLALHCYDGTFARHIKPRVVKRFQSPK